jgi:hypothetical protein
MLIGGLTRIRKASALVDPLVPAIRLIHLGLTHADMGI